MRRRIQAFLLLLTLLAGMLPAGAQSLRVCRQEVVRLCPMSAKSGGHSKPCCCGHRETLTSSSEAPAGCCNIQQAPERPETTAVLNAVDAPALALSEPVPTILAPTVAPALIASVFSSVPPLRGPPGARRSPRAPPFAS